MHNNTRLYHQYQIYLQRVKSLEDDGYRVVVRSDNLGGRSWFIKLRHPFNGNVITVIAWPNQNRIRQWTNDKLVHDCNMI